MNRRTITTPDRISAALLDVIRAAPHGLSSMALDQWARQHGFLPSTVRQTVSRAVARGILERERYALCWGRSGGTYASIYRVRRDHAAHP